MELSELLTPRSIAELVSLAWTPPTVILAFAVVVMWLIPTVRAVRAGLATGHDWLILGVTLGFIGDAADNIYWAIPWTGEFLDRSWSIPWFHQGVYPNIVFRQGVGMVAAYCHLRGAEVSLGGESAWLNRLLLFAYCASLATTAALVTIALS